MKIPLVGNVEDEMIKKPNTSVYTKLTAFLAFFSFLASFMIFFRILYTGNLKNAFLIWNLFLAWIPFLVSLLALFIFRNKKKGRIKSLLLGLLFFVWFFFYPNAPYIITDFIHISQYNYYVSQSKALIFNSDLIIWYDFILIAIFSMLGLTLGFLSIFNFQSMIKKIGNKTVSWLFVIIATYITGIGIYIGRFIRWNSWDVLLHPIQLVNDLIRILRIEAFIFAFLFFVFLVILHALFYLITKIDLEK